MFCKFIKHLQIISTKSSPQCFSPVSIWGTAHKRLVLTWDVTLYTQAWPLTIDTQKCAHIFSFHDDCWQLTRWTRQVPRAYPCRDTWLSALTLVMWDPNKGYSKLMKGSFVVGAKPRGLTSGWVKRCSLMAHWCGKFKSRRLWRIVSNTILQHSLHPIGNLSVF